MFLIAAAWCTISVGCDCLGIYNHQVRLRHGIETENVLHADWDFLGRACAGPCGELRTHRAPVYSQASVMIWEDSWDLSINVCTLQDSLEGHS